MSILFKGDNKALIISINALLALDAKGALAPHGIGGMARDLLETCAARLPTEQHNGELVELPVCNAKLSYSHDWDQGYRGGWRACLDEVAKLGPLYNHADPSDIRATKQALESLKGEASDLRTQLAERTADRDERLRKNLNYRDLLRAVINGKSRTQFDGDLMHRILMALSASAEPSSAKCEACKGNGVIGWTRGQTAESFEQGESPCEDCNATGYAHSNGMAVSGTCATCNGLGTVPDGEISGLDGIAFENGPVECVKDCPDCGSGPDALTDLATWKRRAIEAESKLRTYDPKVLELSQQEVASLLAEPRPSEVVLMKCVLCDQLQADLTERDQQIDALSMDAGRYRWLRSRDLETISKGGVFAGLTPDNLVLNEETLDHAIDAAMAKPKCRHCGDTGQIMVGRSGQAEDGNAPIMEPCEDCDRGMPDLASRPEERGTPETEPCSGCGTPGWTGACNKCVPY
ncbi:hypothetical protein ACNFBR_15585 [Pseudomonas sp. NY11955]|uniref:hypothetical protein n=1 Tax=Pseudomonas sp. NY11955 TaxID=3400363 RepID=UPI003A84E3D5